MRVCWRLNEKVQTADAGWSREQTDSGYHLSPFLAAPLFLRACSNCCHFFHARCYILTCHYKLVHFLCGMFV